MKGLRPVVPEHELWTSSRRLQTPRLRSTRQTTPLPLLALRPAIDFTFQLSPFKEDIEEWENPDYDKNCILLETIPKQNVLNDYVCV